MLTALSKTTGEFITTLTGKTTSEFIKAHTSSFFSIFTSVRHQLVTGAFHEKSTSLEINHNLTSGTLKEGGFTDSVLNSPIKAVFEPFSLRVLSPIVMGFSIHISKAPSSQYCYLIIPIVSGIATAAYEYERNGYYNKIINSKDEPVPEKVMSNVKEVSTRDHSLFLITWLEPIAIVTSGSINAINSYNNFYKLFSANNEDIKQIKHSLSSATITSSARSDESPSPHKTISQDSARASVPTNIPTLVTENAEDIITPRLEINNKNLALINSVVPLVTLIHLTSIQFFKTIAYAKMLGAQEKNLIEASNNRLYEVAKAMFNQSELNKVFDCGDKDFSTDENGLLTAILKQECHLRPGESSTSSFYENFLIGFEADVESLKKISWFDLQNFEYFVKKTTFSIISLFSTNDHPINIAVEISGESSENTEL